MSTRRKIITLSLSATLAMGVAASAAGASPSQRAVVVHSGESIQAAIDRAPGTCPHDDTDLPSGDVVDFDQAS